MTGCSLDLIFFMLHEVKLLSNSLQLIDSRVKLRNLFVILFKLAQLIKFDLGKTRLRWRPDDGILD